MKQVILTGATGMIGQLVLQYCIESEDISKVTSITRRPTGMSDDKLIEVIHTDFTDYQPIREHFKSKDIAYFCLGVYTGAVPDDKFKEITVDYTNTFVDMVKSESPQARFCLLSGSGADQTEESSVSFAKYKGMAENHMFRTLEDAYSLRPGYIYPVEKRKEPNVGYRLMRALYPVMKLLAPKSSIPSTDLARAMFDIGMRGAAKQVLENVDLTEIAKHA